MIQYQRPQCALHSEAFSYFCESCNEPVCKKCTVLGPHNNELHLVNHIQESCKQKIAELSNRMMELPHKRQLLLAQIYRLEYRLEQVKILKSQISKQTLAFGANANKELERHVDDKIIMLKRMIQDCTSQLSNINDIGNFFNEILQRDNAELELLANFNKIDEKMYEVVSQHLDTSINIFVQDLPKKLSELRYEFRKELAYDELINAKKQLLNKVLQKRNKQIQDFQKASQLELQKHLEKCQKQLEETLTELKPNLLMCHFCGKVITDELINTECHDNLVTGRGMLPSFKGFCKVAPEAMYFGTGRHFLAPMLNIQTDHLSEIYIECILLKLKLRVDKLKINLPKVIKKHDQSKNGKILKIELVYVLQQLCQTNPEETEVIITNLQPHNNSVEYSRLLKFMQ